MADNERELVRLFMVILQTMKDRRTGGLVIDAAGTRLFDGYLDLTLDQLVAKAVAAGVPQSYVDRAAELARTRIEAPTPVNLFEQLQEAGLLETFTSGADWQDVVHYIVSERATLEEVARYLARKGVAAVDIAAAYSTIPGGRDIFEAAGIGDTSLADVDPFAGVRIDNVSMYGDDERGLGLGSLIIGTAGGIGVARSSFTADEAAALGITEGSEVDVYYNDPNSGPQGPFKVQIFFSDSDPAAFAAAAEALGIPASEGGSPLDDPDAFMANFDIGVGGNFLGVKGTPVKVVGPDGRETLVPPVFEGDDPGDMYWRLSGEARLDYQLQMEKAGMVMAGSSSPEEWIRGMTMVMSNANGQGLTRTPDAVGRQWGIARSLLDLGERPRPVAPFIPATRSRPDPVMLAEELNMLATERAGRPLNNSEMHEFIDYLNVNYELGFDQADLVAQRQHIQDQVALGAVPSSDEQRILNQETVTTVDPQARLRKVFEERMAGAIDFQNRRGQAQRTRESVFDTMTMARRASG